MVDHLTIQLALRDRIQTLAVVATGALSLSVAGGSYTRTVGSFLTDGFAPGMELVAAGFGSGGNNGLGVIVAVSALTLEVDRVLDDEGADTGRSLAVGPPSRRSWENLELEPLAGSPWLQEQYLPGPASQITVGPRGLIECEPLSVWNVHVPEGTDIAAASRYADAVLALFPPRQPITLATGDVIRVRENPAPFRGQLLPRSSGWVTVPVTIPLRLRTANSI